VESVDVVELVEVVAAVEALEEAEAAGEGVAVVAGSGAPLPAVSAPNPILLSDNASIFPVTGKPFFSWYFFMASVVAWSHFPVGSPS